MKIEIDVEQLANDIKAGKSIGGKDGALILLIKQLTEVTLEREIDIQLTQDLNENRIVQKLLRVNIGDILIRCSKLFFSFI